VEGKKRKAEFSVSPPVFERVKIQGPTTPNIDLEDPAAPSLGQWIWTNVTSFLPFLKQERSPEPEPTTEALAREQSPRKKPRDIDVWAEKQDSLRQKTETLHQKIGNIREKMKDVKGMVEEGVWLDLSQAL
jgi:hypothetical protein